MLRFANGAQMRRRRLNPLHSDDSLHGILEIASAYQKSKILLTACELDIFTAIGDEAKTSLEVAEEIEANEKSTERLMNALAAVSLLNKKGRKFENSKGARNYLVAGKDEYIGNMIHLSHLWQRWETLTESVLLGSALTYKSINEKRDEWIESFVESMHWSAQLRAPDIVQYLDLSQVDSVLDLGCGSGLYAMELKKLKPQMEVTMFDYPRVLNCARKQLEEHGLQNKINVIEGDFLNDDIGKGYDLVFVSEVVNEYSLWENVKLFDKIFDALNFGGKIAIQETVLNDNRISPEKAALLSINLLVNTKSGDALTESDIWIMLKQAWFSSIERIETEFGTSLFIAKR